MSLVVAIKDRYSVHFAADRRITAVDKQLTSKSPKIWQIDRLLFGLVGSLSTAQLVNAVLHKKLPKRKEGYALIQDLFLPLWNELYDPENGTEVEGLASVDGEIYVIGMDKSIYAISDDYYAVGSGQDYALGSLYSTEKLDLSPKERLTQALEAASFYTYTVAPPFDFLTVSLKDATV
jgi:ATP-dependent protease HslVU (ClpYQ) peptidase subunit